MNIVEMQLQILLILEKDAIPVKKHPKLLIDVDTTRYEPPPPPHSVPMMLKNQMDNGHNLIFVELRSKGILYL
jgi:hypothetical protein